MAQPTYYFVYGNHGSAPAQLEDYFNLIRDAIAYCTSQPLKVSQLPVPGAWNIVIENFDENFVYAIRSARKTDPRTRVICLVTEFLTGDTFNNFEVIGEGLNWGSVSESINTGVLGYSEFLFPKKLRNSLMKSVPNLYWPAKATYCKLLNRPMNVSTSNHYSSKEYWKNRFKNFEQLVHSFDSVWFVAESQRTGYEALVESSRLWHLPIIPFSESPGPVAERDLDIDFLFTGTVTPYRMKPLGALERAGRAVVIGPANLPEHIRADYLNRTKICVHLKPSKSWRYSSNMRLHTLLLSGKVVVAEMADEPVIQDRYIQLVQSDNFVDYCLEQVANLNFTRKGEEARSAYISDTRDLRRQVGNQLNEILGFATPPQLAL